MYTIETHGLTHQFNPQEIILKNIEMQVPAGSIYGFLGPNGAGKTTTLRLILGLLKKQSGSIQLFGKEFSDNRIEILQNIGSLIESPSLYGHLTATENLTILQKVYQCPKERIAEVLALVGLQNTGKKKTSQFSLGMKQRLSIAMTLLNSPKLLILDEPTNGLDPNGILEMRELLKKLNREKGITILISSHLLTEIEKLVTHVGIIHKGSLLFQGTLDELILKQQQLSEIEISSTNAELAVKLIVALGTPASIRDERVVVSNISADKIARINRELIQNGVDVFGISTVNNDLETIFMDLVSS